jgi:hypothetical protein
VESITHVSLDVSSGQVLELELCRMFESIYETLLWTA